MKILKICLVKKKDKYLRECTIVHALTRSVCSVKQLCKFVTCDFAIHC